MRSHIPDRESILFAKDCTKCVHSDVCVAMHYVTRRPQPPSGLLENAVEKEQKPPVLVVLHGYGTDEHDLLPIAEKIGNGFLIISLQAPIELHNGGHAWYDLLQTPSGIIPDDVSRHQSEEQLMAALPNIIAREGGDAERVTFMGFSQGAAIIYSLLAVYYLAIARPAGKAAGVKAVASINLSGYLPRDIFEALSEKHFDGFPFFISHGEHDELIPFQALGEAREWLTKQGANVTAKMYPCGHGVLPETVEDIIAWMPEL
jgi:phospholipase/carboxylesterase